MARVVRWMATPDELRRHGLSEDAVGAYYEGCRTRCDGDDDLWHVRLLCELFAAAGVLGSTPEATPRPAAVAWAGFGEDCSTRPN